MSASEQTSASKREPGYYWVKLSAADTWEVGEYFGEGVWRVYGDDLPERYLKEIDERRIERPSPQQQPDRPVFPTIALRSSFSPKVWTANRGPAGRTV